MSDPPRLALSTNFSRPSITWSNAAIDRPPSAAAFWTETLTREGHPLATDLPDEPLVAWTTRGLLGDLQGARVLDIG